jgi:hypothetical protein
VRAVSLIQVGNNVRRASNNNHAKALVGGVSVVTIISERSLVGFIIIVIRWHFGEYVIGWYWQESADVLQTAAQP